MKHYFINSFYHFVWPFPNFCYFSENPLLLLRLYSHTRYQLYKHILQRCCHNGSSCGYLQSEGSVGLFREFIVVFPSSFSRYSRQLSQLQVLIRLPGHKVSSFLRQTLYGLVFLRLNPALKTCKVEGTCPSIFGDRRLLLSNICP